jgi:hypothetical protein
MDMDMTEKPRRWKRGHRNDRDGGRDCVELMQLARCRVDVLEEALGAMGYSEADDNFPEGVERN